MSIQCCQQSPKTREAKEKEQEERKKALRKNRGKERKNKIPWAAYHGHGQHDITVDQIAQHISTDLTGGRCFYYAVLCTVRNSFQNTIGECHGILKNHFVLYRYI